MLIVCILLALSRILIKVTLMHNLLSWLILLFCLHLLILHLFLLHPPFCLLSIDPLCPQPLLLPQQLLKFSRFFLLLLLHFLLLLIYFPWRHTLPHRFVWRYFLARVLLHKLLNIEILLDRFIKMFDPQVSHFIGLARKSPLYYLSWISRLEVVFSK